LSIFDHSPEYRPARVLAGDIGGTNSRLAIYRQEAGGLELLHQQTYTSLEHGGLSDVLSAFLESQYEAVDAVCLGLPAPIHSGLVYPLTNLPWQVDREKVLQAVGTDRVALINDVEASAVGIKGLSEENLVCLQAGQPDPAGNRVVVSVGTGLGVSSLAATGRTFATEAGHASFSPCCKLDFELQESLQAEFGHVSWERVASGPGLERIHTLLAPQGSRSLPAAEITNRAGSDPVCWQAVETLRRYIGSAAGNFALTLMASGGLYLAGGVAPKILDADNSDLFLIAFRDKGRMSTVLEKMPVYLVHEDNLALRGAAQRAMTLLP
jgi:glucokinase